MARRGQTWGFEETNLLIAVLGEEKYQFLLDDCPKRNLGKMKESKPLFSRSASECRKRKKRKKGVEQEEQLSLFVFKNLEMRLNVL